MRPARGSPGLQLVYREGERQGQFRAGARPCLLLRLANRSFTPPSPTHLNLSPLPLPGRLGLCPAICGCMTPFSSTPISRCAHCLLSARSCGSSKPREEGGGREREGPQGETLFCPALQVGRPNLAWARLKLASGRPGHTDRPPDRRIDRLWLRGSRDESYVSFYSAQGRCALL